MRALGKEVIEELIKLKYEIQDELDKGNEYDLSPEEKFKMDRTLSVNKIG